MGLFQKRVRRIFGNTFSRPAPRVESGDPPQSAPSAEKVVVAHEARSAAARQENQQSPNVHQTGMDTAGKIGDSTSTDRKEVLAQASTQARSSRSSFADTMKEHLLANNSKTMSVEARLEVLFNVRNVRYPSGHPMGDTLSSARKQLAEEFYRQLDQSLERRDYSSARATLIKVALLDRGADDLWKGFFGHFGLHALRLHTTSSATDVVKQISQHLSSGPNHRDFVEFLGRLREAVEGKDQSDFTLLLGALQRING